MTTATGNHMVALANHGWALISGGANPLRRLWWAIESARDLNTGTPGLRAPTSITAEGSEAPIPAVARDPAVNYFGNVISCYDGQFYAALYSHL